jgi:SiaC family regulatory phosphoprotein
MKSLIINKKYNSPDISFISKTGELKMSGRAHPENAESTFYPIIEWIEEYVKTPNSETNFTVDLEYFNSSASKSLLKIFSDLTESQDKTKLTIKWVYYDEDSLEVAEDFQSILEFDMEKISAMDE